MIKFLIRKFAMALPLLIVVPFLVFAMIELVPGDPAAILAGENADPVQIEAVRENLNLGAPLILRYGEWLLNAVQGDLGVSFTSGTAVIDLLVRSLGATLSLVALALLIAVVIGVSLAVAAAARPHGKLDRIVSAASALAIAMPTFWLGLLLVSLLAIQFPLFPSFGYVSPQEGIVAWLAHLFLPALALSVLPAAEIVMQLRSSLLNAMTTDYVLNARAKGLAPSSVLFKHGMKNALVPVVTVFGFRVAEILGGTVAIEFIFNISGLGRLALDAVQSRDIPVMLGFVLFTTLVVVVVNLLVDLSYGYLSPKVRA
ncbi:ABC transporter permease [Arthrobacter sp. zg-Y820]|nr:MULTISPECIES: ABC transporter permease [unclassified Arthrobacter]MDK1279669.1 ABC transporter permease [Arthrobacter sp. zg.Y820]WIB07961.1 ABC transporter permease [Arthrobacter sp. zg-Y820]